MRASHENGELASISLDQADESLVRWPILGVEDQEAILRVIASKQLINGPETRSLEREWAAFIGSRHCLAVSSCTHALHLALNALKISPGDEVLVPALTFSGTVSPVIHCGATPVFADVLPGTYELDPADAASKRTPRTKAAIPVHLHGMPCDIDRLMAALPDLPIIEDACQAHGASVNGRNVGTFGVIGCFSLNQVKPLPGGQGGLIVTDSDRLAERLRALASHGAGGIVGWSYGITEFAAAIARCQLRQLEYNNAKGRDNAARFIAAMSGHEDLLPTLPRGRLPVWHKFRVLLPTSVTQADAVRILHEHCVEVDTWPGDVVPDLDGFKARYGNSHCPVARRVVHESVIIGSESYPLAAQHPPTIDRWTEALGDLLDQSHG